MLHIPCHAYLFHQGDPIAYHLDPMYDLYLSALPDAEIGLENREASEREIGPQTKDERNRELTERAHGPYAISNLQEDHS